MCGIVGFLGGEATRGESQAMAVLRRMADAIAYRGPDGDGYWTDSLCGIGIGHRRLAVVDLLPTGAQPMWSPSGRFVLVFNGEIYNHLDLRARLQGPWRGTSDTESMLAGFDAWGVGATLRDCVGMFALAVWDRQERTLTLARDRLGEKPLYYGWQGSTSHGRRAFLFASELGALRAHPSFDAAIDRSALRSYMRYASIAGTASIFEGIQKLPPGSMLTLHEGQGVAAPVHFWRGIEAVREGTRGRLDVSDAQAVEQLEQLLLDAVRGQMVADVPLGVFLSGGVDSSLVTALMQKASAHPVRTYSIGFRERDYDEAGHAQAVAAHLGTEHTELYVSPGDALALIPSLATIYSEPFADASQIPTHLLARLTRKHVTVALSGDGGDELFCGYNRYLFTDRVWRGASGWPPALRRTAAHILLGIPASAWDTGLRAVRSVWPAARRWTHFGEKVHKAADVLASRDIGELYLGMVSHWRDPGAVVRGGDDAPPVSDALASSLAGISDVERMMALDMLGYLCDDVLVKVDRAAMATSLETRAPFLDHRVVEFAWRLPLHMKLRDGQSKWVLRQVLYRHVPPALIERPKAGFSVPIGDWLRGPLRDWAGDLLSEQRLASEGYLVAAPIRKMWSEHLQRRRNWDGPLWTVLMFQAWLQAQQTPARHRPAGPAQAAPKCRITES